MLIGAILPDGHPGFVLLHEALAAGLAGHGEVLLDEDCAAIGLRG